jgi:hypothetical protein
MTMPIFIKVCGLALLEYVKNKKFCTFIIILQPTIATATSQLIDYSVLSTTTTDDLQACD